MSTSAIDSQGMTVEVGDGGSPESFTVIPEIYDISGPGGQASEINTTDVGNSSQNYRIGLPDEGNMTLSLYWIPTNVIHKLLRTQRSSRTKVNFRLTFGGDSITVWSFAAFITSLETSGSGEATAATVTLRLTGSISQSVGTVLTAFFTDEFGVENPLKLSVRSNNFIVTQNVLQTINVVMRNNTSALNVESVIPPSLNIVSSGAFDASGNSVFPASFTATQIVYTFADDPTVNYAPFVFGDEVTWELTEQSSAWLDGDAVEIPAQIVKATNTIAAADSLDFNTETGSWQTETGSWQTEDWSN